MTSEIPVETAPVPAPDLPVVPLRDNVVFPYQLAPLAAGRPRSVAALEEAAGGDSLVVLAVQRDPERDEVGAEDLHPIAVVASVGAFRRLMGGAQALVEGRRRVRITSFRTDGSAWRATIEELDTPPADDPEQLALAQSVRDLFADYASSGGSVPAEITAAAARSSDPARIADLASAAPDLSLEERVGLLQETDVTARLRALVPMLARQGEVATLRARINEDVQNTINKAQREHILREQLRALRKELSELEGGTGLSDPEDLALRVEESAMPEPVKVRARKEAQRLEQIPSGSPEVGMVRTYLDWLLDVPWGEPPPEHIDIAEAQRVLDEDHYGLREVKERLIEWLAVRQRAQDKIAQSEQRVATAAAEAGAAAATPARASSDAPVGGAGEEAEVPAEGPSAHDPASPAHDPASPAHDPASLAPERAPAPVPSAPEEPLRARRALQTPILCFVGPPGVGKTSLGRSVARALGRRFVRMSLGGVRDEAEIRGHRRTYIGALPGRIIQSMKTAGTSNPVIMLDEIDKVGMDFRGDPSAALLEVLDPEQNREFSDHYLEVPYDLSYVLFITTANLVDTISPALRDRMEVIRISGYTEEEKLGIAQHHLVPHQLEQHGLDDGELSITPDALRAVLQGYTHEAGVRQLDRTIARIARKVPRQLIAGEVTSVAVTPDDLTALLGPPRYDRGEIDEEDQVGAVTGVVVSEVGGDLATVEALTLEGRSEFILTGQLGSVMEESARAALSWARVHGGDYGVPVGFFDGHGVHIHVPAGAVPKDGPSAGVTMVTAVISAASDRPVRRDIAMTGEITLRGRVLPIGGVKDKLLAAQRAGLKAFILPRRNLRDLHDVDREILDAIEVVPVDTVKEVLDRVLLDRTARVQKRQLGFTPWLQSSPPPPEAPHVIQA